MYNLAYEIRHLKESVEEYQNAINYLITDNNNSHETAIDYLKLKIETLERILPENRPEFSVENMNNFLENNPICKFLQLANMQDE